ncbi:MAG: ATP-grasp domain-containing protein [Bacteroidetes bacterium]|mgnify:CR=1 FL=1|jgi:D-alanine-D-alanine ligase|nr:ATP-grasp domain-containing protein [Bacteroidota bacterium]
MTEKKCFVIYNKPGRNALADELDVLNQADEIKKALGSLGITTYTKAITGDFMNEIESLASEKPDFVFNLVESINNKGELCYFIPALLNMHSIPYSGNTVEALFITTSKILTGKFLRRAGIQTPESYSPSQYEKLKTGKRYIIKPVWEDGSSGITQDSVFTWSQGNIKRLQDFDDSHWLIEEYIDGREFNISVLAGEKGPEVLPLAEIVFQNFGEDMPRIVDFKAKWIEDSFEYKNTVRCFPDNDIAPELMKKIYTMALECWSIFGLKGYARIDMRVDNNDIPYVIEVNANPCISPDSGFIAASKKAGLEYTDLVKRIINDMNS